VLANPNIDLNIPASELLGSMERKPVKHLLPDALSVPQNLLDEMSELHVLPSNPVCSSLPQPSLRPTKVYPIIL
jgi:hypothetical protein